MPPRKKAKKSNTRADQSSTCSDTGPRAPDSAKPDQAGTVRRNVRGRRGGLKDMPNMPLDILMEIFAVMHPKDLMNLARTSKSFRAFLMSISAKPLWKASMEGVEGLPKCPPYLSEPVMVNLLFFTYCHLCLKPNVQSVIFVFSARYCPTCKQISVVDRRAIQDLIQEIYSVVGRGQVQRFFPTFYPNVGNSALCHKPEVDRFQARWQGLDLEGKKALLAESAERLKQIDQASREFEVWKEAQKNKRSAELDQIRAKRFESIEARLRQGGWDDELNLMTRTQHMRLSDEKFATKAELLTDRGWDKIRDDVFTFMERIRAQRLEAERKAVLHEHFKLFAQAYDVYHPPETKRDDDWPASPRIMDFACMADFRSILDVPENSDISILNDSDVMRAKFEVADARWRQDRKDELTAMVRQSLTVPDGVDDPLTLATALFHCISCGRKDLAYPNVIAHPCLRVSRHSAKEQYLEAVRSYWHPNHAQDVWGAHCLKFSTEGVTHFRPILKACGLDPNQATHQEAAKCETRLTRKGGPALILGLFFDNYDSGGEYQPVEVYDCVRALAHTVDNSYGTPQWERISGKERSEVSKVEDERNRRVDLVDQGKLTHGCHYCDFTARRASMMLHLNKRHDIQADKYIVTEHTYLHPDSRPEALSIHLPAVYLKRYLKTGKVSAAYAQTDLDFLNEEAPWDHGFEFDPDIDPDDDFWLLDDDLIQF